MKALKIVDIREWLIDNRSEYQKLKALIFPPFKNFYWTYKHLYDFIKYYKYKQQCEKALSEVELYIDNFSRLTQWTRQYEILGSQDLLMFEVNYIKWDEDVNTDVIKIHEGLYAQKKPFASILCFCRVFQHLYWDNCMHEVELNESENNEALTGLRNILNIYHRGSNHC